MWDTRKLALTGFANVAEGRPAPDELEPAIEEVSTVSLLQLLQPGQMKAKLLRHHTMGPRWDVEFENEERRKYQEYKMQSKLRRATAQLEAMKLAPGRVEHIEM
jgi:hypothetical protein